MEETNKDYKYYYDKGKECLDNGQYDQALEYFFKALELNSDSTKAYLKIAHCYELKVDYDQAIKYLDESIRIDPKYYDAYIDKGYMYRLKKDYEKAQETIFKAIEINPDSGQAYFGLGNIYNNAGDINKAIEYYKLSIEKDPKFFKPYANLANTYYDLKQYKEAIENYEVFLSLKKSNLVALWGLGSSYFELKNYKKSLYYFKLFLDNEVDDFIYIVEVLQRVGYIYYLDKKYDMAIEFFEKAISLDPKSLYSYSKLGSMYFSKKVYDKTIERYEKLLELDPDSDNIIHRKLGYAYSHIKDYDKSYKHYSLYFDFLHKSLKHHVINLLIYAKNWQMVAIIAIPSLLICCIMSVIELLMNIKNRILLIVIVLYILGIIWLLIFVKIPWFYLTLGILIGIIFGIIVGTLDSVITDKFSPCKVFHKKHPKIFSTIFFITSLMILGGLYKLLMILIENTWN